MKVKIIKAFVCVFFLNIAIFQVNAAADFDGYSGKINFCDLSSYTGNLNINTTENCVGNTMSGNTMTFNNVDFGNNAPSSIEITYSLKGYDNTELIVAIDSVSNKVGTVSFSDTGSWTGYQSANGEIYAGGITGVHTLFFICNTSPVGNLRDFQLDWRHERITAPTISTFDMFGKQTDNLSLVRKVSAQASVDKNTGTDDEPENITLIASSYDDTGAMIDLKTDVRTVYDGTAENFQIEKFDKITGTANIGAFLWNSDLAPMSQASILKDYNENVPASGDINVLVSGANVTISGNNAKKGELSISVFPKDSAVSIENAVQIYQLFTENGEYEYSFSMNAKLSSGEYVCVVTQSGAQYKKSFEFVSLDDFYNALLSLSEETSDDEIFSKLKSYSTMLGIEEEMLLNDSEECKKDVGSAVKSVFLEMPLKESDNYMPWIKKLSNNLIPVLFIHFAKNATSEGVEGILTMYADELGINDKYYKKYYTKLNRQYIAAAYTAALPDNVLSIPSAFLDATVIGAINASGAWGDVSSVLLEFYSNIGIDISKYNSLSNQSKSEVCSKFFDCGFVSLSQIKEKFTNIMGDYKNEINTSDHPLLNKKKGDTVFTMKIWQPELIVNQDNQKKVYGDLDNYEWAKEDIEIVSSLGIMNGKSDTAFAPGENITREEFVCVVMRAFNINSASSDNLKYEDIDKNGWYASYLAGGVEHGIISGISDTEFGVGQNITREQIAAILMRTINASDKILMLGGSTAAYTDSSKINEYAYDSVMALSSVGILNGVSQDKFMPSDFATRAQTAVIISRTILKIQ